MNYRSREHVSLTMEEEMGAVPFSSYPRPQLKRDSYLSLNGPWDEGIMVPFPLESGLSGFTGEDCSHYTYRRTVEIPEDFVKDLILLHFQAVDCLADVYVDGEHVGAHAGGYLPFTCDITRFGAGVHELKVAIVDETSSDYPYGKQTLKPGGMWYTPVSGIWQSVWIESVPKDYIRAIRLTPSLEDVKVKIEGGTGIYSVRVYDRQNPDEGTCIFEQTFEGTDFTIKVLDPKLWSPEEPNLYGLVIESGEDKITSYFGLRTIGVKEINGRKRICLNGRPYFFHGVLDQGYYPQGIFLPNNESGYGKDILKMKALGFNTLRKHIKVEPACFYEACDRLGMIVFQDMVNNAPYSFFRDTALPTVFHFRVPDRRRHNNPKTRNIFLEHAKETVSHLYNYPCICYYTIFNEGWGQFHADAVYDKMKQWDETRIIDATSGWFHQKKSDVLSTHCYFKPVRPVESKRPVIVSEMGGYSLQVPGHYYNPNQNYGYKTFRNAKELTDAVTALYENEIIPYIAKGLCGSIYTQLSDVEDETNGFYTYDRRVLKVEQEAMCRIAEKLHRTMKKETDNEVGS
ncbi:MAG: glycoside hydrolase family 2 [Lachnospiraceae bacterium]|nr:glycoside hydrolase family 2 [Lachnospiraceae bacterium]